MQKRVRRAHGIHSRKVSVSISADDLKVLASRAKRLHGGNVSAVVHEMVEAIRRLEAADELLVMLNGERITEQDLQKIRDEVVVARRAGPRRNSAA